MAQQSISHKPSAAVNMFNKTYTGYIMTKVLDKYGPSYVTPQNGGKQWRTTISWSQEIEDFLIFESKMFIRLLDSQDARSTDLSFLYALTRLMADYLAKFCMMAPGIMTRKQAFRNLHTALYDKFGYIQRLAATQAAAREVRAERNRRYTSPRPQSRTSNASTVSAAAQKYCAMRNIVAGAAPKNQKTK
ncbi:MAG: hypothetical protein K2L94_04115 [Alphaproteobacteria bacterium]|nr:hypothetical protein [Alphaproteobacteria bacterium]